MSYVEAKAQVVEVLILNWAKTIPGWDNKSKTKTIGLKNKMYKHRGLFKQLSFLIWKWTQSR